MSACDDEAALSPVLRHQHHKRDETGSAGVYVFSEGRRLDDWSRMGVNSAPRGQLVKRIDVCGVVMARIERRFEEGMARTGESCEEVMAKRATRGGTMTPCFVGSSSTVVSVAGRRVPIITDQP